MLDLDATVLAAAQAAFAEVVVWVPGDWPSQQVAAIFFDGVVEEKEQDGIVVTERVTRIDIRRSAFPRIPAQGDLFQVRGRLYTTVEALDDGVGCVSLRIRVATDAEVTRAMLPPVAAPSA